MVCAKCQKLSKGTTLATPEVKKKSEMYYGSPASASASSSKPSAAAKSATLGQTGVSKVRDTALLVATAPCSPATPQSKLLSKSAKNPYAQYSRCVKLPAPSPRVLALM